jgi:DNA polymerase-4
VAHGSDPGIFAEEPHSRSLSSETTFERDRKDRTGIERILLELCHEVMFRMIEEGWKSKTVALKLRFHDFTTISAQKTLKHWVSSAEELHGVARELLSSRWSGGTPVRLVGIGCSNLSPVDDQDQLELFADAFSRRKKAEEAVFRLRRKMGDATVTKASLMDRRRRRDTGTDDAGEGDAAHGTEAGGAGAEGPGGEEPTSP